MRRLLKELSKSCPGRGDAAAEVYWREYNLPSRSPSVRAECKKGGYAGEERQRGEDPQDQPQQ
jgi:hypothetical protein